MNKKKKSLFKIALIASSLGYIKYQYSLSLKSKDMITKEKAKAMALTSRLIKDLELMIKPYSKKLNRIIKYNNEAVDKTDTRNVNVYVFALMLLGIYLEDKKVYKNIRNVELIMDIQDIMFSETNKKMLEHCEGVAQSFYTNLEAICTGNKIPNLKKETK